MASVGNEQQQVSSEQRSASEADDHENVNRQGEEPARIRPNSQGNLGTTQREWSARQPTLDLDEEP